LEADPCWKSTSTPTSAAFFAAIFTNVLLMSRPVIAKGPSFASSMQKYPGPGATSSTQLSGVIWPEMRCASSMYSCMTSAVLAAYHFAIRPSMARSPCGLGIANVVIRILPSVCVMERADTRLLLPAMRVKTVSR
jgi:hypothetical protein